MRIRIHNSILKGSGNRGWTFFRLNKRTFVEVLNRHKRLYLTDSKGSELNFLSFDTDLKRFYEEEGFGNYKEDSSSWWNDHLWMDLGS